MIFFELLEKLKTTDTTLILYALLNRIPIIVYGNNAEKIDDFLIDLSELIHFRKEFIFYTDFISNTEYHDLVMNENIDYNTQKTINFFFNAVNKLTNLIFLLKYFNSN